MKAVCTQDKFKKAIFNCERVVSKKNTLPILNNILIETEKNSLKFCATNLEIGVVVKIGAKVDKKELITVPARLLSNFSANLPEEGNIELEIIEDKLKIKSGTNRTIIKGMAATDFPLIPSKKTEYLLELSGLKLKNIITQILPAAALNEARQELTGVDLILKEKEIFFASTDSFRLAEYKLKLEEKNINKTNYPLFIEKNENIIVPASTLIELNRIISSDEESLLKIAIEDGQIFFEFEGVKLVSRLINGKYPDYKHIMPEKYKTRVVGEKQIFQNIIKMASIFSSGGSNEITFKINSEKKKFLVQSSGPETGENSTELNFDVHGPSQEAVFNSKYILDGINTINTSQVAVLLNSESTPVAVKEIDEKTGEVLDDFIYIVMPIRN